MAALEAAKKRGPQAARHPNPGRRPPATKSGALRRQRAAAGAAKRSKGAKPPQGDQPRKAGGRGHTYRSPRRRRPRPQGRWAAGPANRRGPEGRGGPAPPAARGSNAAEKTASRARPFRGARFAAGASRPRGPKNSRKAGFSAIAWQWARGRRKNEGRPKTSTKPKTRTRAGGGAARTTPASAYRLSPRGHSAAGNGPKGGGHRPPMAGRQLRTSGAGAGRFPAPRTRSARELLRAQRANSEPVGLYLIKGHYSVRHDEIKGPDR